MFRNQDFDRILVSWSSPIKRTLIVGGADNVTNNQVAALYGRLAGVTPKISHVLPVMARVMSMILKPFQPDISRILSMNSLPDDAFDEKFEQRHCKLNFPGI